MEQLWADLKTSYWSNEAKPKTLLWIPTAVGIHCINIENK